MHWSSGNLPVDLKVLLIAPSIPVRNGTQIIGSTNPLEKPAGIEDVVDLLSASNFEFDLIVPEQLSEKTFVADGRVRYAAAILAVPYGVLSVQQRGTLEKASLEHTVSMVGMGSGEQSGPITMFGIRNIQSMRSLPDNRIEIERWPFNHRAGDRTCSYGIESVFTGARRRGFSKISFSQVARKLSRYLKTRRIPFGKAILEENGVTVLARCRDLPVAWSSTHGRGTNYFFSIHRDYLLSRWNTMHRLFRSAIETNSGFGLVGLDLENTMVLRMDDPGASSTVFHQQFGMLEEEDWTRLGEYLKEEDIPLSVMYTSGWVDDADASDGDLFVDGTMVSDRKAGTLYPSASVRYESRTNRKNSADHSSEYRGLRKGEEEQSIDVQSHGLTHLHPDRRAWASSNDRHSSDLWYREFYDAVNRRELDLALQCDLMTASREKIEQLFNHSPVAISPSGHLQGDLSDLAAFQSGFHLFSSDFTSIKKADRVIRNWKIPSLFLHFKTPGPFLSESGYPCVGVFHDYELKEFGLEWLRGVIGRWKSHGVDRFVSLRDLATMLCSDIRTVYSPEINEMMVQLVFPASTGWNGSAGRSPLGMVALKVTPPSDRILNHKSISAAGAVLDINEERSDVPGVHLVLREIRDANVTIRIPLLPGRENA